MKKFFLIDGSGFLYRAYYAFPEMINDEGKNINVAYGFIRMLLKVFEEKPDYLMIARDAPTKTKRHDIYPEYKANRVKAPDDFKQQIPLVQHIMERLGVSSIVKAGYEADDIIATIAKSKANQEVGVTIYSSDKDLKQLLSQNIFCQDPMKYKLTKEVDFKQEFGFEAQYMLDYLALIGDGADNIKGVPGIGPKGASTLIKTYKSLDNIYAHIDEIGGSIKEKLLTDKEAAYQSLELIKLIDVPEIDNQSVEDYRLDINFDQYKQILIGEYKFTSMEKKLQELKNKFTAPQQDSLF